MARNQNIEEQGQQDAGTDRTTARAEYQVAAAMILDVDKSRPGMGDMARRGSPGAVCAEALKQYLDMSDDIFRVKSGQYQGYRVPRDLRCAIFQSNVAVEAGVISPRDVTIRALEFGQMIRAKGYIGEVFSPGRDYPNGTYLVGNGARDGTNSRHVAVVCDGQIIHTNRGRIVREPISNKFFEGAYSQMRAYIPPRR